MGNYFKASDFDIFNIDGLDERMGAIRKQIQPVFQHLGDAYIDYVNDYTKFDGSFHIAQHRRRTTNAPESTWSAIGGNNRGYKKYPHIQVGINEKNIFMFLSLIDNPKHEKTMGDYLLNHRSLWKNLDDDYFVSGDHTRPDIQEAEEDTIEKTLKRLINVKKGEFMLGRVLTPSSEELKDNAMQKKFFKDTLNGLLPMYKELLDLYQKEEMI
ncbi:DUF1054 family protein [Alkalibacterium sp. f15]|uniref:DUF1054 family protein n=1 Tax=Alkalibacterium sp. f15 TaxID=3414029 RepID=UPI003BF8A746